jgi:hypothetical protein
MHLGMPVCEFEISTLTSSTCFEANISAFCIQHVKLMVSNTRHCKLTDGFCVISNTAAVSLPMVFVWYQTQMLHQYTLTKRTVFREFGNKFIPHLSYNVEWGDLNQTFRDKLSVPYLEIMLFTAWPLKTRDFISPLTRNTDLAFGDIR